MSKSGRALILLASIGALLAILLLAIPRRPVPPAGGGQPPHPVPEKEPEPLAEPGREPGLEPGGRPAEPQAGPGGLPQAAPSVAARPMPEERPVRLAIVIDDVGYSLGELKEFLALPFPLAFSVLPDLPHSREAGRLIAEAGKELLVHLPMEPSSGSDPGPGAVLTSQSDEEIRVLLERSLERLPQAAGLNNHMGSRATADRRVMGVVLGFLRGRGLFFLDSRTTADTVGPEMAGLLGVRLLERDVFLDNENTPEYIEAALRQGLAKARSRGSAQAVLIGHVQNAELAGELRRLLPALAGQRVELVPPSVLAAEGGGGEGGAGEERS